ncbi:MAG: hypothetical protein ACI9SJ_001857 [Flavobacteriaceae bacterium]|jgi:hypothetical protein|uniref:ice-binding family protein n=1 Tax=Candidatus Marifrigoribacter sp. Uisw_064 TaxID=3230970 RepID=UPI003AEC7377
MKTILKYSLIQLILLISSSLYAQVGIGTTTPDASSMLDISSTSKGLLLPRLTTLQRDNITLPATGLMIFNTTSNDGQLNAGTPLVPRWIGVKAPKINSATESNSIGSTSTNTLLVPGMTLSPESGTYIVSFNAHAPNQLFSSGQGVIDMDGIYQAITAMPNGTTHALVFGNGETLFPGVYDVAGAPSIATGTLTLNGNGDPNSLFIIRGAGAFSTATGAIINLTNGASSNNIFWMSEAALSTAANTIMKGNLVSGAGAIALGANGSLEGRMLTKAGGLSIGANSTVTPPSGVSPIDLGILSSFAMFTSSGAASGDATSTITGDVGTGEGALTVLGAHYGGQYPAGSTERSLTTAYCIYQNGVEVVNSNRTINSGNSMVSLRAMVTTLTAGEAIEVRWKVYTGEARLDNRTLSLIRSGY